MAIPSLPQDFKEFLKLLDSNGVDYLLIGGYAVNIHGYVRTTEAGLTSELFLPQSRGSHGGYRPFALRFLRLSPASSSKLATPKSN